MASNAWDRIISLIEKLDINEADKIIRAASNAEFVDICRSWLNASIIDVPVPEIDMRRVAIENAQNQLISEFGSRKSRMDQSEITEVAIWLSVPTEQGMDISHITPSTDIEFLALFNRATAPYDLFDLKPSSTFLLESAPFASNPFVSEFRKKSLSRID